MVIEFWLARPGDDVEIQEKSGSYDENHGKNLRLVSLQGCGEIFKNLSELQAWFLRISNCEFMNHFSVANFDFPLCNVVQRVAVE